MNPLEIVDNVVSNLTENQIAQDSLVWKIEELIRQGDVSEALKCRNALRFLTRWKQYNDHVLSDLDFLCALRNLILFVGRIAMPNRILRIVREKGLDFGLSIEAERYATAVISRAAWKMKDGFINQAYGCGHATPVEIRQSVGDARLYRCTGFETYRSFEQKAAVQTALTMPAGYTFLLSLPTGAGKSLVSQMLAAMCPYLTVVVVPTTALGKDQERVAHAVLRKHLQASSIASYCGDVLASKREAILKGIRERSLRLLFTSPESLIKNTQLKEALEIAAEAGALEHLIIDEAHIVQEWGALFRPDFQVLSAFRKRLMAMSSGRLKTVLLSATLTEEAIGSLKQLFSAEGKTIELRCDALRREPRYIVDHQDSVESHIQRVLHYAKMLPKPMLIYEIRPENAEKWKQLLVQEGFKNIVTFTGETDDVQRERIIKGWSRDEYDMIIATSAFGMGIDKSDVRTVLHATIPENVNRFYQEVGRAGRDGLPCLSVLCYGPQTDVNIQWKIVNAKVLTVEKMLDRWFTMFTNVNAERQADTMLLDTSLAPTSFSEEERQYTGVQNMRWNINLLLFMIRNDLLSFEEAFYHAPTGKYFLRLRLIQMELLENPDLLRLALEPLRQYELQSSQDKYSQMRHIIEHANSDCIAESYVELFPNAEYSCGGCMAHEDAYGSDVPFLLHNHVVEYGNGCTVQIDHAPWNGRSELLVARESTSFYRIDEATRVALKLNTLGLGVWIAPDCDLRQAQQFSGMVLSPDEAGWLCTHHISAFNTGTIVSFGDNPWENQRLYAVAKKISSAGIPVAYHVRGLQVIDVMNRSIQHLLNASVLSEAELMEGTYV